MVGKIYLELKETQLFIIIIINNNFLKLFFESFIYE